MADKQISDLTEAGALDGSEEIHLKQGANSRRASFSGRIKSYFDTLYIAASLLTTRGDIIYRGESVPARLAKGTQGQVLGAGANDPEWIDPPTGTGAAVSVLGRSANSSGARADIAAASNGGILSRVSNALGFNSLSTLIDLIGSTRGALLYRGASGWAALSPGTSGHVLTSNGSGADPSYQEASGGGGQPIPTSSSFAVGTVLLCWCSVNDLANGSTTSGANLQTVTTTAGSAASGSVTGSGFSLTGTWRNINGAMVDGSGGSANPLGLFVRTA